MNSPSAIDDYLSPSPSKLTHPDKWPMIAQAAQTISSALLDGKTLAVWGDYDVDGITATALVLDVLEFHGFHPLHHLPDRRTEGYGLNMAGIEKLAAQGCEFLLTVDCGTCDFEEIKRARELGMEVIVSDHHLPSSSLPDVDGIVNPRMENVGHWPCTHLAAVGVAFYLMAEVNRLLSIHTGLRFKMDNVLDLVALGTLADIMNLDGENRILTNAGLAKMQKPLRPGLMALKSASKLDPSSRLSSEQAIFQLTPRLNAAGRMGDPDLSLALLRAPDFDSASDLAEKVNACNTERKETQNKMFSEAFAQAHAFLEKKDDPALVLFGEEWHPGIIGIVAAKIVEEFNKPCVALCPDGEYLKGSGRALEGMDLHSALGECQDCLISFGGHKMAAGLKLKKEDLPLFRERFNCALAGQKKDGAQEESIFLDGDLDFAMAYKKEFLDELLLMEPFGPGNPEPVFKSPKLLIKSWRYLGHGKDSIMLELEDTKGQEKYTMRAKLWRCAHEFPPSLENRHIIIAYTPKISEYKALPSNEVLVRDWRLLDKVNNVDRDVAES